MARVSKQQPAPAKPPAARYAKLEEGGSAGPKPPTLVAPAFVFTHHPMSWVVRGGKVRPDLSKVILEDGRNHVSWDHRTGKFDLSGMRDWLRKTERTEIPWGVDAPDHDSYMVCPSPGIYVDRFSTTYAGSPTVTTDEPSYLAWLDSLVDRGLIKPPRRDALEQLRGRLVREYEAYAQAGTNSTGNARNIADRHAERCKLALEVVEEAIAKCEDMGVPLSAQPVSDL